MYSVKTVKYRSPALAIGAHIPFLMKISQNKKKYPKSQNALMLILDSSFSLNIGFVSKIYPRLSFLFTKLQLNLML